MGGWAGHGPHGSGVLAHLLPGLCGQAPGRAGPQPRLPVLSKWAAGLAMALMARGSWPTCYLACVAGLQGPWPCLFPLWASSFHGRGPGFYIDCSIITRAFLTSLWGRESSHRQGV